MTTNQLDHAGQAIVQLVGKAADVAEGNTRRAMDRAQKLSHQLRAAEDRVKLIVGLPSRWTPEFKFAPKIGLL